MEKAGKSDLYPVRRSLDPRFRSVAANRQGTRITRKTGNPASGNSEMTGNQFADSGAKRVQSHPTGDVSAGE